MAQNPDRLFYDAPPTNDEVVQTTFREAFSGATNVKCIERPARTQPGKKVIVGYTVPWDQRTTVKQVNLNKAWGSYYEERIKVETIEKKGQGLVALKQLYPGEYFPYFLGGVNAKITSPSEEKTALGEYAVSLCYAEGTPNKSSKSLERRVAAEANPSEDNIPVAGRINEAAEGDKINATFESYAVPAELAHDKTLAFFPAITVSQSIPKDKEVLTHYGDEYERKGYKPLPKDPSPISWEHLINYIYWKDKWYADFSLDDEDPSPTATLESVMKEAQIDTLMWNRLMFSHQSDTFWAQFFPDISSESLKQPVQFPSRLKQILDQWNSFYKLRLYVIEPPAVAAADDVKTISDLTSKLEVR